MSYIQYRKKGGRVVSFSKDKNKIDNEKLGQIKIDGRKKNQILSNENDVFIKDGELKVEKRQEVLLKDKRKKLVDKVRKGDYTNEELAELLNDLIK